LPGDFNQDDAVDAADYVMWRNSSGRNYLPYDYEVWRSHAGQTAGGDSTVVAGGLSVPEPGSTILGCVGIVHIMVAGLVARRRGRAYGWTVV
jgi:hypothetical protein